MEALALALDRCPQPVLWPIPESLLPPTLRSEDTVALTDGQRIFLSLRASNARLLKGLLHEWAHLLLHGEYFAHGRGEVDRLDAEAEAVAWRVVQELLREAPGVLAELGREVESYLASRPALDLASPKLEQAARTILARLGRA